MHIFDIETGADPLRARALMPSFDEAEVKLGNLKDPEKIAAKIEEERASHESDWLEKAALRPETGQVLAIGIIPQAGSGHIFHIHQNSEEETILAFWDFFDLTRLNGGGLWVGHNILQFDIPFLVIRSRILGLRVPANLRHGRYFSPLLFCDTMDEWLLGRRGNCNCKLDHVAKSLGCGAKNGNGAEFAALYETDESAALEYLRNDLAITAAVAQKLGVV